MHQDIDKRKTILKNNSYAKSFFGVCIKKEPDKVFIRRKVILKASKNELICALLFIGKKSLQLRTHLVKSIESNLKFCKLDVIFRSPCKFNLLFIVKIPCRKKSALTLIIDIRLVTARLLSKYITPFFIGTAEHMAISNLTGKRQTIISV